MKYTVHKIKNNFVITSDETPIKKGELYYNTVNYQIFKLDGVVFNHCKKVIAQQNQIDFSALSEEEQKEIGWFDKVALSMEASKNKSFANGIHEEMVAQIYYRRGFQKAQELLSDRFTLEEMKLTWIEAYKAMRFNAHRDGSEFKCFEDFIQSQSKSWDIEGEFIDSKFKISKLCQKEK